MKILVSIRSLEEFESIMNCEVDIIDLKNPDEGSLGATVPWLISQIKDLAPNKMVSAAIGDMPNLPGTAALAALGAASSGADYVKVGLFGVKNEEESIVLLKNVVKAVKSYNNDIIVVGAGFADARNYGGVNPMKIPLIAKKAGADVAMLDTKSKNGESLFSFLSFEELKMFVNEAHSFNLLAALAGSLKLDDLSIIHELGADVTGFRGALCSDNDRIGGIIEAKKVNRAMKIAKNVMSK